MGEEPPRAGDDPARSGEGPRASGDDHRPSGDDPARSVCDDPERAAARFAAVLTVEGVPEDVLDRARLVLADALGADLLAGSVAGYEVCARTGIACDARPGYHPHGLWGAVGAAVAVARARGYDADGTLAAAGFPGLDGGIARHLELACADGGFDAGALSAGLGERWELHRGYFKPHAACRFTHPAIDAVADLQERVGIDPGGVGSVTVETYPVAARLDAPRPRNQHEARFSVPFAVATRLLRGASEEAAFGEAALTDEAFDLTERVAVEATDGMTDRLPDARSARVTVHLRDGTEHASEVRHAAGSAENPVPPERLRGKFEGLVAPTLGSETAGELWETVHALPDADPRAIGRLLRG